MNIKCAKCGTVTDNYARIEAPQAKAGEFLPYCQACAKAIGAWQPEYQSRARYIGPPVAAPNIPCAVCASSRPAVAKCDTCGVNLCERHWWKHSHAVVEPATVIQSPIQIPKSEIEMAVPA